MTEKDKIVDTILPTKREYLIFRATEGGGLSLEQIFSRKLCESKN
jgi:hypothetical protein